MNEIVKFDNYMNKISFKRFKAVEFDLLMTLCGKLRDKDTNIITFSFSELKKLSGDTKHSNKDYINSLKSMNRKLMEIICEIEMDGKIIMFVLFPTFEIDSINQTLTVCVNERFKFILNEITKNFTRFDLKEFIKLESKYSKTLYRLLKQYKTTGRYEVGIDDFKEKMDSPKTYTNKQFMQNIVNPALEELKSKNCFQNLVCTVKYAQKRGKPVVGYLFTFELEKPVQQYIDIQQGSKKQSKPKEKRKSTNKFCNFKQHNYSKEDMEKIERALLQKSESIIQKHKEV